MKILKMELASIVKFCPIELYMVELMLPQLGANYFDVNWITITDILCTKTVELIPWTGKLLNTLVEAFRRTEVLITSHATL